MGYSLLHFETRVKAYKDAAYGKEPGWLDAMRKHAARSLADKIMGGAFLYRKFDGDPDDPLSETIHRWQIGVQTDLSELAARERQMAEAERRGMARAASLVRAAAARLERCDGGVCKWVIMDALRGAAEEIDDAHRKEKHNAAH